MAASKYRAVLLGLLITIATVSLITILSGFITISGDSIQDMVYRRLWKLRLKVAGPPEIGIWQKDPVFGWINKPDAVGNHMEPLDFDVTYHLDNQGHRDTKGSYNRPKILFLGGSYTFGHGVQNKEAYPSLLQEEFPGFKIINGAVMGWGTGQAYLKLKQQLSVQKDIQLVVYSFINHHKKRNYLRKEWLLALEQYHRKSPYFAVIDDQLVFRGLAHAETDGIEEEGLLAPTENTITIRLIREMRSLATAASVPFMVIHLPDWDNSDYSKEIISVVGEENFFNLNKTIPFSDIQFRFDEGHFNATGHQRVAHTVTPLLKNRLHHDHD